MKTTEASKEVAPLDSKTNTHPALTGSPTNRHLLAHAPAEGEVLRLFTQNPWADIIVIPGGLYFARSQFA